MEKGWKHKMSMSGKFDKLPLNLKKRLDKANSIILKYNGRPITEVEAIKFNNEQMPESGYNGGLKAFKLSKAKDFDKATKRDYQTIGDALIDISRKMSGKDIYAKGGEVKSKIKMYKLRAEGLNDFLAFLQKGMYFRVKSFTVETTSGPDVVVSFKTDASLSEIKSKLNEVPDSHVMLETIKPIKEYTGERNEEYAKGGGVYSGGVYRINDKDYLFVSPVQDASGNYKNWKAYEIVYDDYDGEKHINYELTKKTNRMKTFPSNVNLENVSLEYFAKGGGVGTSSKLKYSLYLDRTVGDNVTTYHIADFAAKGDLSIALESLKAAAPKNYMYYTK